VVSTGNQQLPSEDHGELIAQGKPAEAAMLYLTIASRASSPQKQNIQLQLAEIENAINELEKSKEDNVYELVGNILIKKNKNDLLPKLKEAKETLNLRISTLDKQIDVISKKVNSIQKKFSEG